jgi:predicted transcriptional regulator
MVTVAIQLPDEQAERLAVLAERLHLSPQELATAHVLDLLAKPDERFEEAARYVLEKNAELYRRLA